jgi:hypothetical protein
MNYKFAGQKILQEDGVEESTMMGTACLRYKGDFMAMFFDKEDALIVKVSPQRVNDLIAEGTGREFNFTKKRFKEWVLIDSEFEADYSSYLYESLDYLKGKNKSKAKK